MNDMKTGNTYGAGVALSTATKQANAKLTSKVRNPKGTPVEQLRCPYHHRLYCNVLGHTSAASKQCFCHEKSKEERKVILLAIRDSKIEEELALLEPGKFTNLRILVLHSSVLEISFIRDSANFI